MIVFFEILQMIARTPPLNFLNGIVDSISRTKRL